MRGCVKAAALLLSLSFSSAAFSQCLWTPRFSGQFRTSALDVALDGSLIWLATGYGVQLLERTAAGLSIVDAVALPGTTRVVRPDGNGLVYVGSGSRIYVLRRDGRDIQIVRTVEAGATVNDIAITSYLFVATATGIGHYALFDPTNPAKTAVILQTTAPNVTSLAVAGSLLYAADGDTTVEIFSISTPALPQHTGTLESAPQSSAVHVGGEGFVYVSDRFGTNTDVFNGTTRLARIAFGASSFASSTEETFLAGPNRTLRAADFSNPNRVTELFEWQLAPTDGTDNVIHALARSGETLYVAAGDAGLVTFDVSTIARPYSLVRYAGPTTTSAAILGSNAYFADLDGMLSELTIDPSGLALQPKRSWSGGAGAFIRDARNQLLLTSSDVTTTVWLIAPQSPTAGFSTTFAAPVSNAVLRDDGSIVVLLNDGSLWSASSTQSPQAITTAGAKISFLARAGNSLAVAEEKDEHDTVVRYYASGNLTTVTRELTFGGIAVGGLAIDATRAAVFTFSGINVGDVASGNISILADSDRFFPRQLAFSGSDLLVLGDQTLEVWSEDGTRTRDHTLPLAAGSMAAAAPLALVAGTDGMMAIRYATELPVGQVAQGSSFYTKAVATDSRIALAGSDRIDLFGTSIGFVPHFIAGIGIPSLIDVAATETATFALSGNGTVTAYSAAGARTAQVTLDEGADAIARSIWTGGKAVWVSFSKGCTVGACEKETFVLDPSTLAVTATMTGAIDDVFVSGSRAYALVGLPDEIRVIDIADPLHPSQVVAATRPPSAASIAYAASTVYVLSDKVHSYAEATLAAQGEQLTAVTPNASTRIRTDGGCAVISGRAENVQLYTLPAFTPVPAPTEVPSQVRSIIIKASRLLLLTDHSLEVWASAEFPGAGAQALGAVGGSRPAVGCSLFAVRCSLFAVRCLTPKSEDPSLRVE